MFPRVRGIRASYRRPRGRPFEICFLKAGHSSDPSKGLLSFLKVTALYRIHKRD